MPKVIGKQSGKRLAPPFRNGPVSRHDPLSTDRQFIVPVYRPRVAHLVSLCDHVFRLTIHDFAFSDAFGLLLIC